MAGTSQQNFLDDLAATNKKPSNRADLGIKCVEYIGSILEQCGIGKDEQIFDARLPRSARIHPTRQEQGRPEPGA